MILDPDIRSHKTESWTVLTTLPAVNHTEDQHENPVIGGHRVRVNCMGNVNIRPASSIKGSRARTGLKAIDPLGQPALTGQTCRLLYKI